MTTMKNRKENLKDVDRAFINSVMFELDIIPMEKTTLDMRRALSQLQPEEARRLKRKFRKLWRQAMRREASNPKGRNASTKKQHAVEARLGVGKSVPSRAERNARKQLVFDQVWETIIVPLIRKFENPDDPPKDERSKTTA